MAEFDFEFTYSNAQEPMVGVRLAAGRARARNLGISWSWRTVGERRILVTVNGTSRRTDLLGYRLERDLPLVAEGCDRATRRASQRTRVGRGLADLMLRGRHVEQDDNMRLRGIERTRWRYPPYDYDCPGSPRLHARLSITEELLVAWNFQEIAPEVLLEELHTACELVLEELVNQRSKKLSFAQLVAGADAAGFLGPREGEMSPSSLLAELKDLRKDVRHRAAQGAEAWLQQHWEDVAILLERVSH